MVSAFMLWRGLTERRTDGVTGEVLDSAWLDPTWPVPHRGQTRSGHWPALLAIGNKQRVPRRIQDFYWRLASDFRYDGAEVLWGTTQQKGFKIQ